MPQRYLLSIDSGGIRGIIPAIPLDDSRRIGRLIEYGERLAEK